MLEIGVEATILINIYSSDVLVAMNTVIPFAGSWKFLQTYLISHG